MTFDIKVSVVQQRRSGGRAADAYNDQKCWGGNEQRPIHNTRFSKKKIIKQKKNDQKVEEKKLPSM
jgi:hypothetical protein